MKKSIILIAACAMCLNTAGCGQRTHAAERPVVTAAVKEAEKTAKTEVPAKRIEFVTAAGQAGETVSESLIL